MTYCVGMLVEGGLVMIADTRTNAGVDNISSYRKLHTLAEADDRLILASTAGNLSITQTALGLLEEGLPREDDDGGRRTLHDVPSMFRAAQLVGDAVRMVREDMRAALEKEKVSAGISVLVGGRIGDAPLKLYHIYSAGNFIECQADQPFLQIGETKYGKPILDRALKYGTPVDEAVKVGLISFDSTIRSNLAVGRPLDLTVLPSDRTLPVIRRRIEADDAYFNDLSARWSLMLNEARDTIPDPPFMGVWREDGPGIAAARRG
ncbi:MAG: peptidase [Sphingomonadaceae bacterium]|nr:peptidase [Sphingomonadaceae bacterium]